MVAKVKAFVLAHKKAFIVGAAVVVVLVAAGYVL